MLQEDALALYNRTSPTGEGEISPYIERIIQWFELQGFTVDRHAGHLFETDTMGKIFYTEKKLELNVWNAKDALMTCYHEAGHLISYIRMSELEQPPLFKREQLAKRYGWALIRLFQAPITKAEWNSLHEENYRLNQELRGKECK